MRILIVGAGVIGTVYGAQLGAAGHTVSVLRHPPRTGDIAIRGLATRDVLAADRQALALMCAAVTEAFTALRKTGVTGLPRNLAILHSPALKPVAVRYWGRTMRSPAGELCFAAHARHAQPEMRALGDQVIARLAHSPATRHLFQLLQAPPGPAPPAATTPARTQPRSSAGF